MISTLSNSQFTLALDAEQGRFSVRSQDKNRPDLENVESALTYQSGQGIVRKGLKNWSLASEPPIAQLPGFGKAEFCSYQTPLDENGIICRLSFGVLQDKPLIIWKIEVQNTGSEAIEIDSIDLFALDTRLGGHIRWPKSSHPSELGIFSNGWQSWSPTQWYSADQAMQTSKLGGLQLPMIQNHGTPLPKKKSQFSSDFFTVIGDRLARTGFVLGSLSQRQHFTSIFADFNQGTSLRMWANGDGARLDSGRSMATDWAVLCPVSLDQTDPLSDYFQAVSRENDIHVPQESPAGWCSWYHFYTHISEPIIDQNLDAILAQKENLPIQLVQIDDGFESQIGDWFTFTPEFPCGVAPLADRIKQAGYLPGLWLAPFILHPKAEIIKQHPDWLLRKENGKPVNAGFVWGALTTALDLTVPAALEYACSVVKTASKDWGYPYLKLDFLYAAAVQGKYHDPTLTRAQVLRRGMQAIRDAVGPDVTLLGCGAPLGSMLGLIEAMRIGADVSGDWTPAFNGIQFLFKSEPSMPCARNSIRNILTRANLHQQWWINDPDCLLIRPDTHLRLAEVQSLASVIALTGGSLLVSDDLPKLPADRLRIAEVLLPIIGQRAQVLDWFDAAMPAKLRLDQKNESGEWFILTKFNWSDAPTSLELSAAEYDLPAGEYWVSEFWQQATCKAASGETIRFESVPAHGCVVTAWRKAEQKEAVYLGSDLHISQGLEVAEWKSGRKEIKMELRLPRKTSGIVKFYLPSEIKQIVVNEQTVPASRDAAGVLTIPVSIHQIAKIEIKLV